MLDDDPSPKNHWLDKIRQYFVTSIRDKQHLIRLLREAESRNIIDTDTLSMLEGVLLFSQMQVRDIMIPRPQMVSITEDQSFDDILQTTAGTGHSRFPVFDRNLEEVVGILHSKELLKYQNGQRKDFDLEDILRPAVFVPESKCLNILLKEFRANRNHMAIVIDEYGTVAGFVTIEDILEQIVGDIEDEFDIDEEAFVKRHSAKRFMVKAHMPLDEFDEYFATELTQKDIDTIGGVVVNQFGYIPQRGESTTLGNFKFTIINADNRRIKLMRMDIIGKKP